VGHLETGTVDLVGGRQIVRVSGEALRAEAERYDQVAVDVGAGDGRFVYRLAREHPEWFCLAVDADAGAMRDASFRAGRKPARGGVSNARFIRAGLEQMPGALAGLADEVYVLFPWGSLLRGVVIPDRDALRKIARLGRPGARFHLRINASALRADKTLAIRGPRAPGGEDATRRLAEAYAQAGMRITHLAWDRADVRTSWAGRLGAGKPVETLSIEAESSISRPCRV
jgi:16S rRNA (adenine(1408)-N(1))-methyltransferase